MTPAELIKQIRKSAGLSQAKLGKKIGVTAARVSDYELGKYVPSSELLMKIIEVTGYDIVIEKQDG